MNNSSTQFQPEADDFECCFPPNSPIGQYKLLWKGDKLGGKLYLTHELTAPNRIYYVLIIQREDYKFVGAIDIPVDIAGDAICDVVSSNIEAAYLMAQQAMMKELLKNKLISIQ